MNREQDNSCEELSRKAHLGMHSGNIEGCETTLVPHAFLSFIAWEFNENPDTSSLGLF